MGDLWGASTVARPRPCDFFALRSVRKQMLRVFRKKESVWHEFAWWKLKCQPDHLENSFILMMDHT